MPESRIFVSIAMNRGRSNSLEDIVSQSEGIEDNVSEDGGTM